MFFRHSFWYAITHDSAPPNRNARRNAKLRSMSPTPFSSGKTEAISWFTAKESLKVSKVLVIDQELKCTNDYCGLGSKKAKDYIVEVNIARINQEGQWNQGNQSQPQCQVPPDQNKGLRNPSSHTWVCCLNQLSMSNRVSSHFISVIHKQVWAIPAKLRLLDAENEIMNLKAAWDLVLVLL